MGSCFPLFDRRRLTLKPLAEREHDLSIAAVRPLAPIEVADENLRRAARAMLAARERRAAIIFMLGAHVIRSGLQRYLIDLMERGLVSGLAGNGACAIHDFELALIGATTESVAKYIRTGQFGLWTELGAINEALQAGARAGRGAGESLGRLISGPDFPHRDLSLFTAAHRLGLPFTVHIGIGSDILHQQPNCDGAALGLSSYLDFLILAREIEDLEGGFFGNFGSAVTGPEVYLKALAMVRNVAGVKPRQFTTLVCDLHDLPGEASREPSKEEALYYYRPWKTILVRTVQDGGVGLYVKGRHEQTIAGLWSAINEEEGRR